MSGHHCLYYHSPQDLCTVAASFFKDGIRKNELCVWIIPERIGVRLAKMGLREILQDVDEYLKTGQLEIYEPHEWYTPSGKFDQDEILEAWTRKERKALELGYSGVCAVGDGSWFSAAEREKLMAYESSVSRAILKSKITALCTYSTEKFSKDEITVLSGYHDATLSNVHGALAIFK